jgi:putative endonuclease
MPFFVYMVTCSDGTIYTGYTSNIKKRIKEHNSGSKGARYTRSRRPVKLSYFEKFSKRREAMRRERAIKDLTRDEKLLLIQNFRKNELSRI